MFFDTTQAKLMAGILLVEILLASVLIGVQKRLAAFWMIPLYLVLMVPISLLAVYDQNCLVVGGCNIWSWVRIGFFILNAVFMLVMFIMVLVGAGAKAQQVGAYAPIAAAAVPAAQQQQQQQTPTPSPTLPVFVNPVTGTSA